jgi:hypothetical protein
VKKENEWWLMWNEVETDSELSHNDISFLSIGASDDQGKTNSIFVSQNFDMNSGLFEQCFDFCLNSNICKISTTAKDNIIFPINCFVFASKNARQSFPC